MMMKIWTVELVNNTTGERDVIATTMSGDDAKAIARNIKKRDGYTVELSLV
jgi:hypothetical protein